MEKNFSKAIKQTVKIIDAWLPLKIQYDRIPGLSVGIVYQGKLVYQKGFGYADVEAKIPATPKTGYRIASISKTFTAVALMQLAERGKINLDDRIEKYIPWFKAKSKNFDSHNITIRQVLSHTAGVFRDGNTPQWATDNFPDIGEIKKAISSKTVVFENLTRFKYSNFGFALLGEVIQKASGMPYGKYVSTHIIKKLGMERTAPDLTVQNEKWLAKGYPRPIPNTPREVFRHAVTNAYASATGFLSNVPDLAKYLSALSLKRKLVKELVGREAKKEMMRKYWATDDALKGESYGLGFAVYEIEKRKIIGHGGGFAGFITMIALDVENDIGVITLSNTNHGSTGQINRGIFETIYQFMDEQEKYAAGKKLKDEKKYEGVYRSKWSDTIIAGVEARLIAIEAEANSPVKNGTLLRPAGKNSFVMESKFHFDSTGERATFIFGKKAKQATTMIWGSVPTERVTG